MLRRPPAPKACYFLKLPHACVNGSEVGHGGHCLACGSAPGEACRKPTLTTKRGLPPPIVPERVAQVLLASGERQ